MHTNIHTNTHVHIYNTYTHSWLVLIWFAETPCVIWRWTTRCSVITCSDTPCSFRLLITRWVDIFLLSVFIYLYLCFVSLEWHPHLRVFAGKKSELHTPWRFCRFKSCHLSCPFCLHWVSVSSVVPSLSFSLPRLPPPPPPILSLSISLSLSLSLSHTHTRACVRTHTFAYKVACGESSCLFG